ncbi:MAG: AAA family ATPase [Nitrososphaerales archaeon]
MRIVQLSVSNFKSFKKLELNLDPFSVFVGPNASGKSNLVSIFRFLKDVSDSGLENAISMHGGVEYVRNIQLGNSKNLSLSVDVDLGANPSRFFVGSKEGGKAHVGAVVTRFVYEFEIQFMKASKYKVAEERLTLWSQFIELTEREGHLTEAGEIAEGQFSAMRKGDKTEFQLPKEIEDLVERPLHLEKTFGKEASSAELSFPHEFGHLILMAFDDVSIYDFDLKLSKKAIPITGKTDLEPDGSNLAISLNRILSSKPDRDKFLNLIRDLLPFVERVSVEKLIDRSLILSFGETYHSKFVPATLISDGTVNVVALIVALYFEEKSVIAIEEPDRRAHPGLIRRIVEMLREASQKTQVIITTHNPEMVKRAGLDALYFVYRDSDGFSRVSRPSQAEEVKTFLENRIGLDDLHIDGLLQW